MLSFLLLVTYVQLATDGDTVAPVDGGSVSIHMCIRKELKLIYTLIYLNTYELR